MNPIDWLRNRASALPASENGSPPASLTDPPLGESSVPRMFSRVDFPEPLGPTTARRSPGPSFRFTPLNTTSRWVGVGYSLRTTVTVRSSARLEGYVKGSVSLPENIHRRVRTPLAAGSKRLKLHDRSVHSQR